MVWTPSHVHQIASDYSSIVLTMFAGWGLNAMKLVIVPEDTSIPLALWTCTMTKTGQGLGPPTGTGSNCDQGLTTAQIGIIAGCSVAGLIVLVMAIFAGLLLVARQKK